MQGKDARVARRGVDARGMHRKEQGRLRMERELEARDESKLRENG